MTTAKQRHVASDFPGAAQAWPRLCEAFFFLAAMLLPARLAARCIDRVLFETEDGAAAATHHMLARVGRRPFGGEAAGHLIDLEIAAGCPTVVGLGNLGKTGVPASRTFQLP